MKKLFQILGHAAPKAGDFGLEIEVEGSRLPEAVGGGWKAEHDGSLRGGMEYVMDKPVLFQKVKPMLQALEKIFKECNSKLEFSFRTSVHVHTNVMDMTHEQICAMIYTYYLIEAPMMNYCGKSRKGNRFCLRLEDAEGIINYLQEFFKQGFPGLRYFDQEQVKYASLNPAPMRDYGSLEFRGMEGNLDINRLTTWVAAINHLRSYAIAKGNPVEVYNDFANKEPKEFLKAVLNDVHEAFIYPRLTTEMQRGFSLSIDLPHKYVKAVDEDVALRAPKLPKAGIVFAEQYNAVPMPAPQVVPVNNVDAKARARLRAAAFLRELNGE